MKLLFYLFKEHWGKLSMVMLGALSFIDPVAFDSSRIDKMLFYIVNLKTEIGIILLLIVVFSVSLRLPKVKLSVRDRSLFVNTELSSKFNLKDLIFRSWKTAILCAFGIIVGGLLTYKSSTRLASGLKYRYTSTIPLRYRVQLLEKAKYYESAGMTEFAKNYYENIIKDYPNLSEVSYVNGRLNLIDNRLQLSHKLFEEYMNRDSDTQYSTDYLRYAVALNQNNSVYKQEVQSLLGRIESDKFDIEKYVRGLTVPEDSSLMNVADSISLLENFSLQSEVMSLIELE